MTDDHYAKLDQRIVYSSMWEEDGDTCKVWVTVLALKSLKTGIVDKNITGIARLCRLPLDKVEEAFVKFLSPDPNSSSQSEEGRRLKKVEGGYLVVNHEKYNELGWSEEKREWERKRKAEQRARKKSELPPQTTSPSPPANNPPKFVKPTREEMDFHALSLGLPPDQVDAFVNHYTSNGWKIGPNPMKDWRASMNRWHARWRKEQSPSQKPDPANRNARNSNATVTGQYDNVKTFGVNVPAQTQPPTKPSSSLL